MTSETATHQLFDSGRGSGGTEGDGGAGLVLLYAPDFQSIPNVVRLSSGPLVIGREPPPGGLSLPHGAVSRVHARIHRRGESFIVTDLDSRNGTMVDGAKVEELVLEDLDEVRIGDAIFKFVARGVDTYAPYRLDGAHAPGTRRPTRMTALVGGAQIGQLALQLEAIAPSDLSVLLLGDTGTGKEVAARAIHDASGRSGRFCAINCAAIPTHLLESELFGYKRGAFSGADRDKPGLVRAAHGGTLLLDEIGDMPIDAQAKLLRLIETREVLPLGATQGEKVDVRLISATHRDLERLIADGKFRGDLFARIHGFLARLPPLRARKEDLYLLLRHLLARHGHPTTRLSTPFVAALCHYDWPYNVRELEAVVRRALALADAETPRPAQLEMRHLPETIERAMEAYGKPLERAEPVSSRASRPPPAIRAEAPPEEEMRALLSRHRGNVTAIARELGKDRVQIHRWMKRYGLSPDDFRGAP